MDSLATWADVYKQYWRINFLTALEYRANFIVWFGFTFVYHASALAALWIVLREFPSMNGWSFEEMAFLYALWMLAHALNNTFFLTVGDVPEHVREGEIDRLMVRPLNALFQVLTTPQQIFPDELILALALFGLATSWAHPIIDVWFIVFVPLVAIGGALIDFSVNLIIATCAFWFVKVDALRWIAFQLEQEFTRYPLSIYTKGVRLVLTFLLPYAFMNYFPATFFLDKSEDALHLSPQLGLLGPLVGLACFAVAYSFWRIGLNHYEGVGH
ncbi:MAG: ABC-2 family transporter protein [Candidatus Eremiobacteraeota bacterium]|nr:ABC-2 family transporter protein [Candidatus Eremiobacteraeota bacterium]